MSRKAVPKQKGRFSAPAAQKRGRRTAQERVSAAPEYSDTSERPKSRLVGYARVSTDEQTTALQIDALGAAGCAEIFEDKRSGAARLRPHLERALAQLRTGDTLVVWKLDRLGRSLRDLLEVAERLRLQNVALRSLTEHIDTSTAAGKMLYAVLGAVAQFERDVLRERTLAGMRAAKARGERLGRPPALTSVQVKAARKMTSCSHMRPALHGCTRFLAGADKSGASMPARLKTSNTAWRESG